jgi:hypothetical protein
LIFKIVMGARENAGVSGKPSLKVEERKEGRKEEAPAAVAVADELYENDPTSYFL